MSDERMRRSKVEESDAREDRALEQRDVQERRELSDEDRVAMFRSALFTTTLPQLPEIPGYHLIWLTTTNSRDTLHQRQMIGYEPVRPEDVPGFDYLRQKDGELAGLITVNEMVAYKIRSELYERYMLEVHHNEPLSEEEKLHAQLEALKAQAAGQKGRIVAEEGSTLLVQRARRPTFT